ncbi:MAG: acyl-CoA thioesterase II [Proteobacteria bacterium]|nr:MAG: acyl-CoA thioesterase II [Pseudomonadota bacterium]
MLDPLDDLLDLLDLEQIDLDLFRGRNEQARPGRIFGGQVAAQSLVAAGRTVRDLLAHSLHGYFLRPGDPAVPVVFTVDRIRDGKSFVTRHVVARQRGKAIFNMSVSFQEPERGYEHQMPMPDAPDPESLPTRAELVKRHFDAIPESDRQWVAQPRPVDVRHVRLPTFFGGAAGPGPTLVWMRVPRPLSGADAALHQRLLAYMSDLTLLDNIVLPHGRNGRLGPVMVASLDHAVWFHRPPRVDHWLLYVQDSPTAAGARGFARGTLFAQDGTLVASVAQEGLLRPVRQPEDRSE